MYICVGALKTGVGMFPSVPVGHSGSRDCFVGLLRPRHVDATQGAQEQAPSRPLRSERLHDFGQYRERLRYWDTEAIQLSPGLLTIDFDRIETANLVLSSLKFDRTSTLRTVAAPGWCTFGLGRSAQRWCGIDVQPNTFFAMAPEQEVHVVTHASFDAIRIAIRRDILASWEAPLATFAGWAKAPEESIVTAEGNAVARFSGWVRDLLATSMLPTSGDDSALWVAAIEARLRKHLMDVVGRRSAPVPPSPIHRVARYDLALTALRSMRPDAQHRPRVADLAATLGVSQRALEYAFAAVIGVSPGQYILAERLNRARHHLIIQAAGGASVTTIAFGHQFDNLSRFAQQYTRLFGERPSDTLRAARAAFRRA